MAYSNNRFKTLFIDDSDDDKSNSNQSESKMQSADSSHIINTTDQKNADCVNNKHESEKYSDLDSNYNITSARNSSFYLYSGRSYESTKKKNIKRENRNVKKTLCHNIITTGKCCYEDKCLYAHALSEQIIEDNRKGGYSILTSDTQLDKLDLHKNINLYKSLLSLTKLCEQCQKNNCTGGYNCRWGACNKKYQVCLQDLNYGNCNQSCECVHLTKRKLIPYYVVAEKSPPAKIFGTLLTLDFFKQLKQDSDTESFDTEFDDILSSDDDNDQINESIFDESD